MRRTGSLIALLLGAAAALTMGARYYDRGMVAYWGDTTLTNLWPGQVYFNTSNTTLYVGNSSSNPVVVGSASWSNNVTASVTNGLASTNFVNDAIATLASTTFVNTAVAPLVSTNDSRALTFANTVTVSNLLLSTVRWTDSPMVFAWPNIGTGSPALTALESPFNGITVLGFADNDVLDGIAQIPHSIAQTNAANAASLYTELHAHVTPVTSPPADANRTRIVMTYSACSIGGAMYGPVVSTTDVVMTSGQIGQKYVDAAHIAATNYWPGISALYYATIKRIAAPASNYTGRVSITADVHFPLDRLGSSEEAAP